MKIYQNPLFNKIEKIKSAPSPEIGFAEGENPSRENGSEKYQAKDRLTQVPISDVSAEWQKQIKSVPPPPPPSKVEADKAKKAELARLNMSDDDFDKMYTPDIKKNILSEVKRKYGVDATELQRNRG